LETEFWKPSDKIPKEENRFIAVFSESQYLLKGGDLILALAIHFPDIKFYIAGTDKNSSNISIPTNVNFLGKISAKELRVEYQKSQFHLQLSNFEGFGTSLCEAMLCECIPIGSSVNIIPEIIGNSGFVLYRKDISELSEIVEKALVAKNKKELGQRARESIINRYGFRKRRKILLETIESL
jgi:glycosyltransferase involved in cell wall biosynthesis